MAINQNGVAKSHDRQRILFFFAPEKSYSDIHTRPGFTVAEEKREGLVAEKQTRRAR